MERWGSENRSREMRRAAQAAIFTVLLAACGSNPTETAKTIVVPSEKPSPTMTLAPTLKVTPTLIPTPEATATPKPITTIDSITKAEVTAISYENVQADIEKVFQTSEYLRRIPDITQPNVVNVLQTCKTASRTIESQLACLWIIENPYRWYHESFFNNDAGTKDLLKLTEDAYKFSLSPEGGFYKNKQQLDNLIKQAFPNSS